MKVGVRTASKRFGVNVFFDEALYVKKDFKVLSFLYKRIHSMYTEGFSENHIESMIFGDLMNLINSGSATYESNDDYDMLVPCSVGYYLYDSCDYTLTFKTRE